MDTIREVMNETIPIEQITPHPRNYRKHPDEQVERLQASLARFGQVRSIVVQRGSPGQFLLVAGHGILQAAREQTLETLRADVIPADWTPEQIEGYMVADNQGGYEDDVRQLATLLQEQRELGYDLSALGQDDGSLDDLLRQIAAMDGEVDFDSLVDTMGGGQAATVQWHVTITVTSPDTRDALVSQLREMGYEPEVTSVREVE